MEERIKTFRSQRDSLSAAATRDWIKIVLAAVALTATICLGIGRIYVGAVYGDRPQAQTSTQ